MRERPILMSAPMVRALLDGRKTMTRRVVKGIRPDIAKAMDLNPGLPLVLDEDGYGGILDEGPGYVFGIPLPRCPYGAPGDLLWVRETHYVESSGYVDGSGRRILYRADGEAPVNWTPSIHMPRWASRLTLRITDVRVERLQEISEMDAIEEGIEQFGSATAVGAVSALGALAGVMAAEKRASRRGFLYSLIASGAIALGANGRVERATPRAAYAHLWDSINAARGYGWDANPWVWVVEFERLDCADDCPPGHCACHDGDARTVNRTHTANAAGEG